MPAARKKAKPVALNEPIELNPGDVSRLVDEPIEPAEGLQSPEEKYDHDALELQRTITGLMDDVEREAMVKVYRVDPSRKQGGIYLCQFTPQEWNQYGEMACIQERYGAGEYRIKVYGMKDGIPGVIAGTTIVCGDSFKPIKRDPETNAPIQSGNAEVIAAINNGNMQIAMMLKETITALSSNLKPQGIGEMLVGLKALDELRGGTKTAVDPLDQFTKFITLQKAMQGAAPVIKGDGGLSDMAAMATIAKEFLPALRDAMKKPDAPANQPQIPATLPDNVVSITPPQPSPEQQQEEQEAMFVAMMIRRKLNALIQNAGANLATMPIAESLLDEVPPLVIDDWLHKPEAEFMATLQQFNPQVANFADWFKKLRADMIQLTTEDIPDTQVPNNSGNNGA